MQNKQSSQQKTAETKHTPEATDTPKNSWEMSAHAALRVNYVTSAQYNTHEQQVPNVSKC